MAKRRKYSPRKYFIPKYIKEALQYLSPPENLTVSEWAAKYRVLSQKTSAIPGPWRNEMTPYLAGIMDELCNFETAETIFCKGSQIGGTEVILNWLGYIIQQDPSPTMGVYPSDVLAESVSLNRIQTMIELSPPLAQRFQRLASSRSELQFEGMALNLVGANSPANLASRPIRFLFLDEVDKFPGASRKEANPISLARERTKTFTHNSKIYMTSTPTLRTGHIWKALEGADVEKHYFVPCPHCGEYIELKWAQVKFPGKEDGMSDADRAEFAVYECQKCAAVITDQHKQQMIQAGEWRAVRQSSEHPKTVAFWLNSLYSPFVRFSDAAREFLKSKDDPEALQNFVNSWLAEPWEDTKLKTNADLVLERQTALPQLIVPKWAKLLTAGVDVQESTVYWTIRAFGNYLTSQNIAHGQALSFTDIEQIMNTEYQVEDSPDKMLVALCLIDSGYNADATYDFCARNSEWALPVKGSSNEMLTHFKLSTVNKADSQAYGMNLVLVDGGKYKDMIASRMKRENGTGSWMVYQGCDREYAEQVTAEHKVAVKVGQRTVQRWVLKSSHADNHYLDTEVYAMAAADVRGARLMHLYDTENQPQAPSPAPPPPPTPEEGWIARNESWIGG